MQWGQPAGKSIGQPIQLYVIMARYQVFYWVSSVKKKVIPALVRQRTRPDREARTKKQHWKVLFVLWDNPKRRVTAAA